MSLPQYKKEGDLRQQRREFLKQKALEMVRLWTQGKRIQAVGPVIYAFPDSDFSLSTTDALVCREILCDLNINMTRVDSGGAPEWEFTPIALTKRKRIYKKREPKSALVAA